MVESQHVCTEARATHILQGHLHYISYVAASVVHRTEQLSASFAVEFKTIVSHIYTSSKNEYRSAYQNSSVLKDAQGSGAEVY